MEEKEQGKRQKLLQHKCAMFTQVHVIYGILVEMNNVYGCMQTNYKNNNRNLGYFLILLKNDWLLNQFSFYFYGV